MAREVVASSTATVGRGGCARRRQARHSLLRPLDSARSRQGRRRRRRSYRSVGAPSLFLPIDPSGPEAVSVIRPGGHEGLLHTIGGAVLGISFRSGGTSFTVNVLV